MMILLMIMVMMMWMLTSSVTRAVSLSRLFPDPPFSHYFPTAATAILPTTGPMVASAGKHSSTQLLQNLAFSPLYPPAAYRRKKISSLRSCPIVFDSYTLAHCTTLEQILQHCNTSEIYSIVPSL